MMRIRSLPGRAKAGRGGALVAALAALAFTSGCGSDTDAGPTEAAEGFAAAVTSGDGTAACELLTDAVVHELESSSGQSCEKAVLDDAKPPGSRLKVTRYGTMAQVRFSKDVLFLTQSPDGWRVLAAACRPTSAEKPYDCDISGG